MYWGTNSIEKVYLGTIEVGKIYLGTTEIYDGSGGGGSTDPDITVINTEKKIYTGFSNSAYILIPVFYTADMTSFSETIKFDVTGTTKNNTGLIDAGTADGGTGYCTRLTIESDKCLRFRMTTAGTTTYAVNIKGTTAVTADTWCYARVTYDSSTGYTLEHSYDKTTWISDGTSSVTDRPYIIADNKFCLGDFSGNGTNYLNGHINIGETEFTLNENVVFNGATAMEGTDYTLVGSITHGTDVINTSVISTTTDIISIIQTNL